MLANAAGWRIEPPVSEPTAPKHIPAATATADPDDDPPAVSSGFHTLRTGPYAPTTELAPYASSCRLSLPRKTAPAARRRAVTAASRSAGRRSNTRLAPVVGTPTTSTRSLSAIGMP